MMIASRYKAARIEANPNIEINNVQIQEVKKIKSLAVILDQHLSWDEQVGYVIKVSKAIGMLRRLSLKYGLQLYLLYTMLWWSRILIIAVLCGEIARHPYKKNSKNFKTMPLG